MGKREKTSIKKKTTNNNNVIMKNQNLNRTPNPMVVAGIRIEDKIAQLMLDGLNIRLYPISKEGDGIIGIMIYTKRGVSLSNMVVSDELLPAFSRMNKKEKNQLFLLMGMIMMSDYAIIVTTECSKHTLKDVSVCAKIQQTLMNNLNGYVDEWNRHLDFLIANSTYKSARNGNNQ